MKPPASDPKIQENGKFPVSAESQPPADSEKLTEEEDPDCDSVAGKSDEIVREPRLPDVWAEDRIQESSRRGFAVLLACILGGLCLIHYIGVILLVWNGKDEKPLESAFHAWLPVISGIVASAATYYFTHRDRK